MHSTQAFEFMKSFSFSRFHLSSEFSSHPHTEASMTHDDVHRTSYTTHSGYFEWVLELRLTDFRQHFHFFFFLFHFHELLGDWDGESEDWRKNKLCGSMTSEPMNSTQPRAFDFTSMRTGLVREISNTSDVVDGTRRVAWMVSPPLIPCTNKYHGRFFFFFFFFTSGELQNHVNSSGLCLLPAHSYDCLTYKRPETHIVFVFRYEIDIHTHCAYAHKWTRRREIVCLSSLGSSSYSMPFNFMCCCFRSSPNCATGHTITLSF